jgi:hypothetical protein
MPINNTIKLPFFLEALLKKRLIDIDVAEYDKTTKKNQNFMQPDSITILFKNSDSFLQQSCVEVFRLSLFTDYQSLKGKCTIYIGQFKAMLKHYSQPKWEEQQAKLVQNFR